MPLYTWRGIDDHEHIHQGVLYAFSLDELQDFLQKNHIGLMHAKVKHGNILSRRQKDEFFSQLASLLSAHIPLYESLCIMRSSRAGDSYFLLDAFSRHVAQGTPLSEVLEKALILDPFSRALICVGESTGTLGPLIAQLVSYRAEIDVSMNKLRDTLTLPLLTLGFFGMVSSGLLVWVVPQCGYFFEQNRMPVPLITSFLIKVSSFMTVNLLLYLILIMLCLMSLIRFAYVTKRGKEMIELAIEIMPIIGPFHRLFMKARSLKILGILLVHQIPSARALDSCQALTLQRLYQKELLKIKNAVERGETFSQAWHVSLFADPEVEGLLGVGEASGRLGYMMLHASEILEKKLFKKVQVLALYAHPVLLVFLAFLVGCLIYAIYIPLIEFSSALN
jgi:type IV pilus assembly protein PilC